MTGKVPLSPSDVSIERDAMEFLDSQLEDFRATVYDRLHDLMVKKKRKLATCDDMEQAWSVALDEMTWVRDQSEVNRDG